MTLKTGIFAAIRARIVALFIGLVLAHSQIAAATDAPLDPAMDAVLIVRSLDAEDRFLGSAFLWGDMAVVAVTNAHVVGDAEEVRLIDRAGREEIGRVIARDALRDVAVIAVAPGRRGLQPSPEAVVLGQQVYALGAPLGLAFTLTEGLISATGRQVDIAVPLMFLQHDAAVNPGSSGGPLVDALGRLLGMNARIADGSRLFVGIAYAIAAPDLSRIVEGLIAETLAPFPVLGLTTRPVDRRTAEALGTRPGGLLVDAVAPEGLAEAAGLHPGDVILGAGGRDMTDPGALAFAVEAALPAGGLDLTVRRDDRDLTLVLPLVAPADDGAPVPGLGMGLGTRDIPDALPERVASYRLGALGVVLEGAAVTAVTDNSPALYAGLVPGDRILSVNGAAMDGPGLDALQITAPVLMLVRGPDGTTRHLYLDPWGGAEGQVRPRGGANVLDPAVTVF